MNCTSSASPVGACSPAPSQPRPESGAGSSSSAPLALRLWEGWVRATSLQAFSSKLLRWSTDPTTTREPFGGALFVPRLFTLLLILLWERAERQMRRRSSSVPGPKTQRRARGAGSAPWEIGFAMGQASACTLILIPRFLSLVVLGVFGRTCPSLQTTTREPVIPSCSRAKRAPAPGEGPAWSQPCSQTRSAAPEAHGR